MRCPLAPTPEGFQVRDSLLLLRPRLLVLPQAPLEEEEEELQVSALLKLFSGANVRARKGAGV